MYVKLCTYIHTATKAGSATFFFAMNIISARSHFLTTGRLFNPTPRNYRRRTISGEKTRRLFCFLGSTTPPHTSQPHTSHTLQLRNQHRLRIHDVSQSEPTLLHALLHTAAVVLLIGVRENQSKITSKMLSCLFLFE